MSRGGDAFGGSSARSFIKSPCWARGGEGPLPPGLNVIFRAYDLGVRPFTLPDAQWADVIYQRQRWRFFGFEPPARTFDFTVELSVGTVVDQGGVPQWTAVTTGAGPATTFAFRANGMTFNSPTSQTWDMALVPVFGVGTPGGTCTLTIDLDQPAPIGLMEAKDDILRRAFSPSLFKTRAQSDWLPEFVLLPDNSLINLGLVTNPFRHSNQDGSQAQTNALANWQAAEIPNIGGRDSILLPGLGRGAVQGQLPRDVSTLRALQLTWYTIKREGNWSESEYGGIAGGIGAGLTIPRYSSELNCTRRIGGVERADEPPTFDLTMLSRSDSISIQGTTFASDGRARIVMPLTVWDRVPTPFPGVSCWP